MPQKNTICLWYDGTALEAAQFYAKTFPNSAVGAMHCAPADYPRRQAGRCAGGGVHGGGHCLHRHQWRARGAAWHGVFVPQTARQPSARSRP